MARVHLGRLEAEQGELPPLCLRCGALAVVYKTRRLAWQPVWTIVLFGVTLWPLLVVSLIIRKRMSVLVPFCATHRHHWLWRGLLALLAYGALAGLVFLDYLFVLAAQEPGRMLLHPLLHFWLTGIFLLGTVLMVQATGIHPVEITDEGITLTGVDETFVERLHKEKRGTSFDNPTGPLSQGHTPQAVPGASA
jgi:hypothetical protein